MIEISLSLFMSDVCRTKKVEGDHDMVRETTIR